MSENVQTIEWMEANKKSSGKEGERENYLKVIRGEQPDWVPVYRDCCDWLFPTFMIDYIFTEEKKDMFGVNWVVAEEGEQPDPNRPLLDDITRWRDFVKFPDISNIDWEAAAAQDLAEQHDPNKALCYCAANGTGAYFIALMNMMGFEDGLCALIEEPEAVMELFETATQFYEYTMRKLIPLYNPDVVLINDDLASAKAPFVSEEIFEEMFRPFYKRLFAVAQEFDVPIEFHMCGKCDNFIRKLHEDGVTIWEPAQVMNDLVGLRKEFGNSLVFNGGYDSQGAAGLPGATEETIRASVRNSLDSYAVGGGYVFWDLDPVGRSEDMANKIAWAQDEARAYGSAFYLN